MHYRPSVRDSTTARTSHAKFPFVRQPKLYRPDAPRVGWMGLRNCYMCYIRIDRQSSLMLNNAVCQYCIAITACLLLLKIEAKVRISDPMTSLGEGWARYLNQFYQLAYDETSVYFFYINWSARDGVRVRIMLYNFRGSLPVLCNVI